MNKNTKQTFWAILLTIFIITSGWSFAMNNQTSTINLPEPAHSGDISIEETLYKRRSIRSYSDMPISLEEASQLLWAAQGLSKSNMDLRTAPSAGATYPLEVYLVAGNIKGLEDGVYKYNPDKHELITILEKDVSNELCQAALNQSPIKTAAANIIICAVYERTAQRYGQRAVRYVHMEAGHAAQNIYLQAVSLKLGTVAIGAFYDDKVQNFLNTSDKEMPLYIMPIGRL